MDDDSHHLPLDRAFVVALSEAMPAGYSAELEGKRLRVIGPLGPLASSDDWGLAADDVLLEDEVLGWALGAVNLAQQEVAEETTEPWPSQAGRDYRGFPEPDAEVADTELRVWFGDRSRPVLELGPFDMSGVLLRDDADGA